MKVINIIKLIMNSGGFFYEEKGQNIRINETL